MQEVIGRFQILLPFQITIDPGEEMAPFEVSTPGGIARCYPPHKSQIDMAALAPDSGLPVSPLVDQLDPVDLPVLNNDLTIDGRPTVQADVVRIDFFRDDFSRDQHGRDWPVEDAFFILNRFLVGLRAFGRAGWITPLKNESLWKFRLLNDDGSEVDSVAGQIRSLNSLQWKHQVIALTPPLWRALQELPATFEPDPWHELIPDAFLLVDRIGPALVLAATAVETRIESALNYLAAATGQNAALWEWINNRGDYRKEPSVVERADALLKAVNGNSLKDDARLWEAFQNLRAARNSFVHDGRAEIGGTRVTDSRALELVASAQEVVAWFDELLPEDQRFPAYSPQPTMQMSKTLFAPTAQGDAADAAMPKPTVEPSEG